MTPTEELTLIQRELGWPVRDLAAGRVYLARHRELERLKAARLPIALSRSFGASAAKVPATFGATSKESDMTQRHLIPHYHRDPKVRLTPPRPAPSTAQLEARVARLEAKSGASREAREVRAFLASRPELPRGLTKLLETKTLAYAREVVDAMNGPHLPAAEARELKRRMGLLDGDARCESTVYSLSLAGTRPSARKAPAACLPPAEKAALDAAMGLAPSSVGRVYKDDYRLVLG